MGAVEELEVLIVVSEGILAPTEAMALGAEAAKASQGLLTWLHDLDRISDSQLAKLRARVLDQAKDVPTAKISRREEGLGETWDYTPHAGGATPPREEPNDPKAFPVPGWDRYEPLGFLGQGGMGRVWLAHDRRLQRNVAIKFVRGDDPDIARRFLSEARAQARVSDDRVCKVYEVGEVHGRVYIAMQHIDGRPLSALRGEVTVEQKAMLIRGAALGVNEAHRVGLIHRDLKPSNVLVERHADGELRPFVVDFGLARDWTEDATMTGTVLGTPEYMAPEQARGEVKQLDRRADVYSLGATLYSLLVGHAPITGGNSLEVLTRVSSLEPPRPRTIDPNIPPDLEAIVMKCLEKERAQRYDSARALADDLERFLAGEAVEARSAAGLGYRLRKGLKRHRLAVAAASAVVVIGGVAIGYGLHERRLSARREQLVRRFTEEVGRVEAQARYSALAPAHDIRVDRAQMRAQLDHLADEIRREGSLADGPGHYALGRGYLAVGDDERAETELREAAARGFRDPRASYALALANGHLYQKGLADIEHMPAEVRAQKRKVLAERYRAPALAALRESDASAAPSLDYVQALIAFYDEHYDEALAHVDAIDAGKQGLAWFYELPLLRGQILGARGLSHRDRGEKPQAIADLDEARKSIAAASAIGESAPAVQDALSELEYRVLVLELYGSGDVEPPFHRGTDATTLALALVPDDPGALVSRARFARSFAEFRSNRGQDATELLQRAVADATKAVQLAPADPEARLELARAYRQWGELRQGRNEDPSEQLARAVETLRALPAAQRDAYADVDTGLVHTVWADYQDQIGQDSDEHRRLAIEAYSSAAKRDPSLSLAWLNLGNNYLHRASQPRTKDIDGDLQRASEALEKGHALDPTSSVPLFFEAQAYQQIADRQEARGEDPEPARAKSIAKYQEGSALSPDLPHFYNGVSEVEVERARDAWDKGADPEPRLAAGIDAAKHAITAAPDQGFGYGNLGNVLAQRVGYEARRGADPHAMAAAAEAAFADALKRLPNHPVVLSNIAEVRVELARFELDHGRDPRADVERARGAVDAVLLQSADEPTAHRLLGDCKAILAEWQAKADPHAAEAAFADAQKELKRAVELAPDDQELRLSLAKLGIAWPAARADALVALDKLIAVRPTWRDAREAREKLTPSGASPR